MASVRQDISSLYRQRNQGRRKLLRRNSAAAMSCPRNSSEVRRPFRVSAGRRAVASSEETVELLAGYLQDGRSGISLRPQGPADISPKTDPFFFARSRSSLVLKPFTVFCCHRIIIQHIPLAHHSMREKELSNILSAPTFNQLQ